MFSVRERHILIDHVSLKVVGLMTSLLEAARVADLGVRRTRPLPRQEVSQRHLAIHPFPLEVVNESGLIMAFRAGHMPVAGGSPRFHVDVHLVTEAAEGRALRKFEKTDQDDEKDKDTKTEEDLDGPEVGLSAFLRLVKEVDPKDLDQIVKISYSSHTKTPTGTKF